MTPPGESPPWGVSRRHALAGAGLAGIGLPLLAGCGDEGGTGRTGADRTPTPDAPSEEPSADEPATQEPDPVEGLVAAADVPVGGGLVLADAKVVVTQPERGDFHAFGATCTHMGCTVGSVTDTINCPCHGSQFDLADGSVVGGPAPSPLPPVEVTVEGGQVIRS